VRLDGAKLDDHKYGGGFGGIAREMNAALEHVAAGSHSLGHAVGRTTGDLPEVGSAFGSESHFAQPPRPVVGPPLIPGLGAPPPPAFAPPPPSAAAEPPKLPESTPSSSSMNGGTDDEDAHVREVFEQFIATKKECGESAAGLTLEKFSQRLHDNRAALMVKHDCRTVRFTVYVKDGKASLRATPVK
jgi:hypothetical protein